MAVRCKPARRRKCASCEPRPVLCEVGELHALARASEHSFHLRVHEEPLEVRERVVEAHREKLPGAFAFQGPNVVHHWVRRYADARS